MPRSVVAGVTALGISGVGLVLLALIAVFARRETVITDLSALLGVAQLVTVGRVVERNQTARVVAISLALLEALGGVIVLAGRSGYGLIAIALAGFIVLPLGGHDADEFFEALP
jgi:hypothetical protein